jgi:general secretion pathway protein J
MRSEPHHCSKGGFTLLELVVALTLLGLVSGLALGLLKTGTLALDRGLRVSEDVGTVDAVQSVLRKGLASAYPLVREGEQIFAGSDHSVTLWTVLPEALTDDGLAEVKIGLEAEDAMASLVFQWRRPGEPMWQKTTLLKGIEDVHFFYFGGQEGWQPTWIGRKRLPEAIRIVIRFSARDRRVWPGFIVAPKLTMDAACIFDVASKECSGR